MMRELTRKGNSDGINEYHGDSIEKPGVVFLSVAFRGVVVMKNAALALAQVVSVEKVEYSRTGSDEDSEREK